MMTEAKLFSPEDEELMGPRRLRQRDLPKGWKIKIIPEGNLESPDSWRLGQVGMVGNIIKPIDQIGVSRGKVRVIEVNEMNVKQPQYGEESFREDLLE